MNTIGVHCREEMENKDEDELVNNHQENGERHLSHSIILAESSDHVSICGIVNHKITQQQWSIDTIELENAQQSDCVLPAEVIKPSRSQQSLFKQTLAKKQFLEREEAEENDRAGEIEKSMDKRMNDETRQDCIELG